MGSGVDFNYIFFGRHERGHRSATAALLLLAVILVVYTYTSQNAISAQMKETDAATQYKALCSKFTAAAGEVSCEEAIELATEKYSAKIQGVEENVLPHFNSKEHVLSGVWIISLSNNSTTIVVYKAEGEIVLRPYTNSANNVVKESNK